jgi:hypothetical protein
VGFDEIEIELQGQQATVMLTVQLHGQGGWLSRGGRLSIQSRWQKVDGQWQVERARWRRLSGTN